MSSIIRGKQDYRISLRKFYKELFINIQSAKKVNWQTLGMIKWVRMKKKLRIFFSETLSFPDICHLVFTKKRYKKIKTCGH